ncbi:MAG: site-specific integrase [Lachnospiraceae bacterium]|nr:site-specific integrase [Lachnospiraceae bacterium]
MITEEEIRNFAARLRYEEKAPATVEKYSAALWRFARWLGETPLTKEAVISYREHLLKTKCAQTVNGTLGALHLWFSQIGREDCRVKLLRVQRQAFLKENRELSEEEYHRLLVAAEKSGRRRISLIMQTICSTGIRVSELVYITVEAAKSGSADIHMKGKIRTVLLPEKLRTLLLQYAKEQGIRTGYLFRTRSGKPVHRSNVNHEMKKLCALAGVDPSKVFPHNLRHLFARLFYAIEKNLAHLADVLGHSRLETTRIYVSVSASAHEKILNQMNLVLPFRSAEAAPERPRQAKRKQSGTWAD